MDPLPSFAHPQAVAAAYAVISLATAWAIAIVGLNHAMHDFSEHTAVDAEPGVRRRRSFA